MKKIALMIFMALGCGDAFCMDESVELTKYLEDSKSTSIPEGLVREYVKRCYGSDIWAYVAIGDEVALEKYLTDHQSFIDEGLNMLVATVANRLPCVKVYLELGADPNSVRYFNIRGLGVNRSYKTMVDYIESLSWYGMNPMKKQQLRFGGTPPLNLFEHIEQNSLTLLILDSLRAKAAFPEETKASLKRVIVRARDAYFSARKDEFEPRIRHHSDRLSRLLNGRTLQPSELPTSLPNELIYKIVWHAWESHPKMAVLNEQITQWEADKATYGLDSVAGQEHRRKWMKLDRATSEITAVAAQD